MQTRTAKAATSKMLAAALMGRLKTRSFGVFAIYYALMWRVLPILTSTAKLRNGSPRGTAVSNRSSQTITEEESDTNKSKTSYELHTNNVRA